MGATVDASELIQGSDEWLRARVGSLGASRVHEVMARTKTGYSASRANACAAIVAERLTGTPTESFETPAMAWGKATEAEARATYEFYTDSIVTPVGLVKHPTIADTHASPDGLLGTEGILEIKCPQVAGHIETLLKRAVPSRYECQIAWQLACTGRKWADFVSFNPLLPEEMRLFVVRVERDDSKIAEITKEVVAFLAEVDAKVEQLVKLYRSPQLEAAE
jgi:putative phage-type endonuclease